MPLEAKTKATNCIVHKQVIKGHKEHAYEVLTSIHYSLYLMTMSSIFESSADFYGYLPSKWTHI